MHEIKRTKYAEAALNKTENNIELSSKKTFGKASQFKIEQ